MQLTKNFTSEEFECPCCKQDAINIIMVKMLQEARDYAGIPFIINSGYRCRQHNSNVMGSKDSTHLTGDGIDIEAISKHSKYIIVFALMLAGFTRIIIYDNHIHADKKTPLTLLWVK